MPTVEKLRKIHELSCELVDGTSTYDPRLAEMCAIRDSIVGVINDLEFGEQPKDL